MTKIEEMIDGIKQELKILNDWNVEIHKIYDSQYLIIYKYANFTSLKDVENIINVIKNRNIEIDLKGSHFLNDKDRFYLSVAITKHN